MICCSDSPRGKRKCDRFGVVSHHSLFISLTAHLSGAGVPGKLKLIRPRIGHSRGVLVGQVDKETVRQGEVQEVADAADLVGEGLGKEALQLRDRLSNQREDPRGDAISKNEKPVSDLLRRQTGAGRRVLGASVRPQN